LYAHFLIWNYADIIRTSGVWTGRIKDRARRNGICIEADVAPSDRRNPPQPIRMVAGITSPLDNIRCRAGCAHLGTWWESGNARAFFTRRRRHPPISWFRVRQKDDFEGLRLNKELKNRPTKRGIPYERRAGDQVLPALSNAKRRGQGVWRRFSRWRMGVWRRQPLFG